MRISITKIILIILIIVLAVVIFKMIFVKPNLTKEQVIELVKSENNKTNYEVEYIIDGVRYNHKYLDGKMKVDVLSEDEHYILYFDFEKNTQTIIKEGYGQVLIQEASSFGKNYIPETTLKVIENPECKIEKEEKIGLRDAIVLTYNNTEMIQGFMVGEEYVYIYDEKIWIDKDTGFLLQVLISSEGIEIKTTYNLILNSVTEEDVALPDLSEYEVFQLKDNKLFQLKDNKLIELN